MLDIPIESFKLKFGLVVPRKSDKDIADLIHKVCRNMRDSHRKALKKAKDAEEMENAEKPMKKTAEKVDEKRADDEVECEIAEKALKKTAKSTEKRADNEAECENSKKAYAEMMGLNWDDFQNYKKLKKARKAAKKAKLAEQSDRDDNSAGHPESKRGEKRPAIEDIGSGNKKQKKIIE